jgi:hypothetical protein
MQDARIVGALVLAGLIFLLENDGAGPRISPQQAVRHRQANDSTTNDRI